MPLDIQFNIEGEEMVSRRLNVVADGVKDFKRPLDQIGRNFLKTFDMNFSQRGALYGGWRPRVDGNPWPLLEKRGDMRGGFTKEVSSSQLEMGNTQDYFRYHQSKLPRNKLPRRLMMKIRQQDAKMIVKEFQYYMIGLLRGQGLR